MTTTPRKYYDGCAGFGGTSNEDYKLNNRLGTTTVYGVSQKELTPMAEAIAHFNSLSDRIVLSHKQVAYILGQYLEAERKSVLDNAVSLSASQSASCNVPGYSEADISKAVDFGFRQCKLQGYISPTEEQQFIKSLTK